MFVKTNSTNYYTTFCTYLPLHPGLQPNRPCAMKSLLLYYVGYPVAYPIKMRINCPNRQNHRSDRWTLVLDLFARPFDLEQRFVLPFPWINENLFSNKQFYLYKIITDRADINGYSLRKKMLFMPKQLLAAPQQICKYYLARNTTIRLLINAHPELTASRICLLNKKIILLKMKSDLGRNRVMKISSANLLLTFPISQCNQLFFPLLLPFLSTFSLPPIFLSFAFLLPLASFLSLRPPLLSQKLHVNDFEWQWQLYAF